MDNEPRSIKAIETIYNGYRFRSRLEARWAVYMDALGVKYQYEIEGYDLDGVWYLPDFWLPEIGMWVEVKGPSVIPGDEAWVKASLLADQSGSPVGLFAGQFGVKGYVPGLLFLGYELPGQANYIQAPDDICWYQCPVCRKFQPGTHAHELPCWCFIGFDDPAKNPDLVAAQLKARQARFEHGERP